MRDMLAGLCEVRAHRSLGCATPLGLGEERGQHAKFRLGQTEGTDLMLQNMPATPRPKCNNRRLNMIPATGASGIRALKRSRFASSISNGDGE